MKSFIEYSPSTDFPIENLPYGVFTSPNNVEKHIGVAIGDLILDLNVISHLFDGPLLKSKQNVFKEEKLNAFMGLTRPHWLEARATLQKLLDASNSTLQNDTELRKKAFVKQSDAQMHVPADIGDYTDFFSSLYHATNCGIMFLGTDINAFKNWKHLPIGYHGRSSSIVISGTPITRPYGQTVPAKTRDIQKFEYVPLGPFTSKNLGTSISPWIVTIEALRPYIVHNFPQDPTPFPYLRHDDKFNFDIKLEVDLKPENSSEPTTISRTNYCYMYWTVKQQLAQQTVTGCNLRPGDLLGSGTISGERPDSLGCMLELSWNGTKPLRLKSGEERKILEDGDTVTLRGYCINDNDVRIGFGKCEGKLLPAVPLD